jgi:F-type H+-transporting ATPase subunit b
MHLSPLLLLLADAAEEKAPPVIDIDGTVFVQFALFVAMYFVLKHLLFQPYLKMRQARSAGIEGARGEAEQMERRAADIEKDYERKIAQAKSRAEEERARLRGEGQARERDLLAEARGVAQVKVTAARKQIAAESQAAGRELARQAQPLARQIASRILGREVQP